MCLSMSIPDGIDATCRIKPVFHQPVRKSASLNCTYGRRQQCKGPKQHGASLCAKRGQPKCFAIFGSLVHFYSEVAIKHTVTVYATQTYWGKKLLNTVTLFQEESILVCQSPYDRNHVRFQDIRTKCRSLNSLLWDTIRVSLMHRK